MGAMCEGSVRPEDHSFARLQKPRIYFVARKELHLVRITIVCNRCGIEVCEDDLEQAKESDQ